MFEQEGLFNRCLRSTWEDHAVASASLSAKAAPALIVGVGRRASGEGTCKRGGLNTVAQSFQSKMHDLRRLRSVAAFPCEVRPCRLASTSTTCQSVAKPPSSILKSGISYISHVLEFAWIGQIDFQCHSHSHTYQILPTIRSFMRPESASIFDSSWALPTSNKNLVVSGRAKKAPKSVSAR